VATIKTTAFIKTKNNAFSALIIPDGISLMAVLGFSLSKCLSKYLLKAIAADLAVNIHTITKKNLKPIFSMASWLINWYLTPNAKPISAKGNAKMVCENLTNPK
jgi:hypothetical protein